MMPPLRSVPCPRCAMIQVVPVASPRGAVPRLRCLACHTPLCGDDPTRVTGCIEIPIALLDLTDDVRLETEPTTRRAAPPPLPRRIARTGVEATPGRAAPPPLPPRLARAS